MAPLRSTLGKSLGSLLRVGRSKDLAGAGTGGAAKDGQLNSRYFQDASPPIPASLSGGTAYAGDVTGAPKSYIRFQSSGTLEVAYDNATVDILVVGGGGAGGSYAPGSYAGGGGGGGGVRWIPSITLPIGTYPVTVGDGGTGGNPPSPPSDGGTPAQPKGGGTSSIFNPGDGNSVPAITATGGGGGGYGGNQGQGTGGSAGGSSYSPGGQEVAGNAGGDEPRANPVKEGSPNYPTNRAGPVGSWNCCGGGGAGDAAGTETLPQMDGVNGITLPGMGSPGDPWLPPAGNIFAGGGGGSSYKQGDGNGTGGNGGGGNGSGEGGNGVEYSGGGGGGGGNPPGAGGNGGYGVVYIVTPTEYTTNPA